MYINKSKVHEVRLISMYINISKTLNELISELLKVHGKITCLDISKPMHDMYGETRCATY